MYVSFGLLSIRTKIKDIAFKLMKNEQTETTLHHQSNWESVNAQMHMHFKLFTYLKTNFAFSLKTSKKNAVCVFSRKLYGIYNKYPKVIHKNTQPFQLCYDLVSDFDICVGHDAYVMTIYFWQTFTCRHVCRETKQPKILIEIWLLFMIIPDLFCVPYNPVLQRHEDPLIILQYLKIV